MVGDSAYRAFIGFQRGKGHFSVFRQQRAAPASRPKRRDRRQCQQLGIDRQNGAMRRQIIGGAAGRRGQQGTIAYQFFHASFAVNGDLQLGRLRFHTQQRHFVNRQRFMGFTIGVYGGHFQRVKRRHFGFGDAFGQTFFVKFIHQKADRAVMHAEDRFSLIHKTMQAGEHQPIAAQRDDNIGILSRHAIIARAQCVARRFGGGLRAGDKGQFFAFCVSHACSHHLSVLHWRRSIATVGL